MDKKIHYCWFGGKPLPKEVNKCIKTWKKFLPDYEIIEWNEKNFDINICPFVKQAYENKKWAFVSDYARIYALYKEGGIYFDTDMKILKECHDIIDKDMFLGYEDSGFVGTAVIGVREKNNKYIKEILDYYNKLEEFNVEIMYNYANPVIITKILKNYDSVIDDKGIEIFNNDVYIYPRDYFFPLSYNYAEREYSQNTCMVHLFNATWTSKGERRTINIYRKFGPSIGKLLNKFIDNLFNIKYRIKYGLLNMYKALRLWYSVHINRNKRLARIKEEVENKESKTILICNPDRDFENSYLEETLGDTLMLREQHTEKEAKGIAEILVNANKETIIFNSLSMGWDQIMRHLKKLKRDINIKVILHGGNEQLVNAETYYIRDDVIQLYAKKSIDEIIVLNKNLYEFYNKKDYKVSLLKLKVKIPNKGKYIKNENKSSLKRIGMYENRYDVSKSIYNQLCAVSLIEDAKLKYNPLNYEISTFARRFNINITGDSAVLSREDLYERLANNDINLAIDLVDTDSLIPIQSLELGVPCIIGNGCKFFEGSELEEYIKVQDSEDIIVISEKIKEIINNKEKVLELYNKWKKA